MDELEVGGIRVLVERKRVRRINVRVVGPLGDVKVSMPVRGSIRGVRQFLEGKVEWIRHSQRVVRQRAAVQVVGGQDGDRVAFLGRYYQLKIELNQRRREVKLRGEQLVVSCRDGELAADKCRGMIYAFYSQSLKSRLPDLIDKWQRITGLSATEWRVRYMKTRWGSCNIEARRIWLNSELIKYSISHLEQVMVHELVHLLEPGHNRRFYLLMTTYMPEWKRFATQLKSGKIA